MTRVRALGIVLGLGIVGTGALALFALASATVFAPFDTVGREAYGPTLHAWGLCATATLGTALLVHRARRLSGDGARSRRVAIGLGVTVAWALWLGAVAATLAHPWVLVEEPLWLGPSSLMYVAHPAPALLLPWQLLGVGLVSTATRPGRRALLAMGTAVVLLALTATLLSLRHAPAFSG